MKLTSEQINRLLSFIRGTRNKELNCSGCLDRVAEFAEYQLAGKPLPNALKAVEHHLDLCVECREEYEALRLVLEDLNTERDSD